jgi:hypothetical protein
MNGRFCNDSQEKKVTEIVSEDRLYRAGFRNVPPEQDFEYLLIRNPVHFLTVQQKA